MHDQFANAFYSTQAWQNCRRAYKSFKGGLCERCLSMGLYTPGTEVHHIIPLTPDNLADPSVTLSFDNLMLLCDACHKAIHHEKKASGKRWAVDESGKIFTRGNF